MPWPSRIFVNDDEFVWPRFRLRKHVGWISMNRRVESRSQSHIWDTQTKYECRLCVPHALFMFESKRTATATQRALASRHRDTAFLSRVAEEFDSPANAAFCCSGISQNAASERSEQEAAVRDAAVNSNARLARPSPGPGALRSDAELRPPRARPRLARSHSDVGGRAVERRDVDHPRPQHPQPTHHRPRMRSRARAPSKQSWWLANAAFCCSGISQNAASERSKQSAAVRDAAVNSNARLARPSPGPSALRSDAELRPPRAQPILTPSHHDVGGTRGRTPRRRPPAPPTPSANPPPPANAFPRTGPIKTIVVAR